MPVNKLLLILLLVIVFVSGCSTIYISNSDIREQCLNQHRGSFQDDRECSEIVCREFNLIYDGSGSWYHITTNCETESGASIEVTICNTNIESCQRVCSARIKLQQCSIERGAGI